MSDKSTNRSSIDPMDLTSILKKERSEATTSLEQINVTSSLLENINTDSNSIIDASVPISLSRPLSAHSLLSHKYPGQISRTQSLKDGLSPRMLTNDIKRRPSSRQSLASMVTLQLFLNKNNNEEAMSDNYSEGSKRNTLIEERNSTIESPKGLAFENEELEQSPEFQQNQIEAIEEEDVNFEQEMLDNASLLEQLNNSNKEENNNIKQLVFNDSDDDELSEGDIIDGPYHRRKYGDEDPNSHSWKNHKHHLFVLSSAGKPIYTRYSDESKMSEYMGIIQAIISFYVDEGDSIRSINSTSHKIIFMQREPLYFVLVSRTNESEEILRDYLHLYYQQIISTLTYSQIQRVFEKSTNFDLRRLLNGTESFLDTLIKRSVSLSPSYLLESIRSVKMNIKLRLKISKAIKPLAIQQLDIIYVILASKYRLVHLLRSHKVNLHPMDLHLLLNLVNSSPAFLNLNQANWVPICLPRFNKSGYLYALISFLNLDPPLVLIILSPLRDKYEEIKKVNDIIIQNLNHENLINEIYESIENDAFDLAEIGIPGLRHFIFKSKNLFQYTSSRLEPPYILKRERRRLFELYKTSYYIMNSRFRNIRIYFNDSETETIVIWSTNQFLLFATFTPFLSKTTLVNLALKLVKYLQADKEQLFITQTTLI
ncbi:DUF254-domain-containing protein [Neoconidiobolus thromboides FSU 785]|nr:DUF254-domain-containing protein [Neoconidiobolus thromboides FSU 785]